MRKWHILLFFSFVRYNGKYTVNSRNKTGQSLRLEEIENEKRVFLPRLFHSIIILLCIWLQVVQGALPFVILKPPCTSNRIQFFIFLNFTQNRRIEYRHFHYNQRRCLFCCSLLLLFHPPDIRFLRKMHHKKVTNHYKVQFIKRQIQNLIDHVSC